AAFRPQLADHLHRGERTGDQDDAAPGGRDVRRGSQAVTWSPVGARQRRSMLRRFPAPTGGPARGRYHDPPPPPPPPPPTLPPPPLPLLDPGEDPMVAVAALANPLRPSEKDAALNWPIP